MTFSRGHSVQVHKTGTWKAVGGLGRVKALALVSTQVSQKKAFIRADSAASKVILEKRWVSSH